MDADRQQAIRERAGAATPPPWTFTGEGGSWWAVFSESVPRDDSHITSLMDEADAEFVAHARTDIPDLLAALAEAEATIGRLGGCPRCHVALDDDHAGILHSTRGCYWMPGPLAALDGGRRDGDETGEAGL